MPSALYAFALSGSCGTGKHLTKKEQHSTDWNRSEVVVVLTGASADIAVLPTDDQR